MTAVKAVVRRRIVAYPAFRDRTEFSQFFAKCAFYISPILDAGSHIEVTCPRPWANGIAPGPDLDPDISRLLPPTLERTLFTEPTPRAELLGRLTSADVVLVWDQSVEADVVGRTAARCFVIDPATRTEGDSWIEAGYALASVPPQVRTLRAAHACALLAALQTQKAYVFGTGPSLSQAAAMSFDDGVSIVCNSAVRNQALLDHVRPKLIVAADPIFHAGCSSYASEFRLALTQAMQHTGATLIIQERDRHIYIAALPSELHDKIIAMPVANRVVPTFDFSERFSVTATKNVLTLFLLPVAFAIANDVGVLGCDGRPLAENRYFWKHDMASQFNDRMDAIQRVHPGFFSLSYDAYYALHCETVRRWIRAAEKRGRTVRSLTASHVPALQSRSFDRKLTTPLSWPDMVYFGWQCQVQFARRALQVTYGAALDRMRDHPRVIALMRLPIRLVRNGARALGLYQRGGA
jgi:hypothetical protein